MRSQQSEQNTFFGLPNINQMKFNSRQFNIIMHVRVRVRYQVRTFNAHIVIFYIKYTYEM